VLWKAAIAAAAAVIAVAVAGSVLLSGGNEVAGPTAGLTDVEIGGLFVERFEEGNVGGYEALPAPDATDRSEPYYGTDAGSPKVIWATASR
jgi:hypothetical protein